MNKLKLWKIESLVGGHEESKKVQNFLALDRVKENYISGVSQFHPDFFLVDDFDFTKSENPVFENEEGDDRSGEGEQEFFGLKKQQVKFLHNKPVYLVDNHNKALYSFFEISKALGEKVGIVHIDAHRDDAIFQYAYPENINWENIDWCLEKTRVSDYLDLAEKAGLVGDIDNITQSNEFKNFRVPKEKYILNLDIDIFGPEGEAVDLELKVQTIMEAWGGAVAVVIATSPGYISGSDAKDLVEVFTNEER